MVVFNNMIMLVSNRRLVSSAVSMYFMKIAFIFIESAVAATIAFWLSLSSSVVLILLNAIFVSNENVGGGRST